MTPSHRSSTFTTDPATVEAPPADVVRPAPIPVRPIPPYFWASPPLGRAVRAVWPEAYGSVQAQHAEVKVRLSALVAAAKQAEHKAHAAQLVWMLLEEYERAMGATLSELLVLADGFLSELAVSRVSGEVPFAAEGAEPGDYVLEVE